MNSSSEKKTTPKYWKGLDYMMRFDVLDKLTNESERFRMAGLEYSALTKHAQRIVRKDFIKYGDFEN